MNSTCGVVFKYNSEKILYIVEDTVWYEAIQGGPDRKVIVVNGRDNYFNEDDVYETHKTSFNAKNYYYSYGSSKP